MKKIFKSAVSLMMVFTLLACCLAIGAPVVSAADEPIYTIGCISDIHCATNTSNLRTNVVDTINKLGATEDLDMVLVMTVEPGYGGQSIIPKCLEKVSKIRAEINARGLEVDIQVDGGINLETASAAKASGANVLVAGSAVFGKSDIGGIIKALKDE